MSEEESDLAASAERFLKKILGSISDEQRDWWKIFCPKISPVLMRRNSRGDDLEFNLKVNFAGMSAKLLKYTSVFSIERRAQLAAGPTFLEIATRHLEEACSQAADAMLAEFGTSQKQEYSARAFRLEQKLRAPPVVVLEPLEGLSAWKPLLVPTKPKTAVRERQEASWYISRPRVKGPK